MLRGALLPGLVAVVAVPGIVWALRGELAALSATAGVVVALVVLVVGLLAVSAVVSGHPSIAMAGALVVYIGQLILLVAALLALRGADWLDGRAFAIGAVAETLVVQVGQIVGYTRARHEIYPNAGEVQR